MDATTLCDLDAEQAVLGAALLDPSAADQCATLLRPEDFWRELHRLIWSAVTALRSRSVPCDLLAVAQEMQHGGAGTAAALDEAGGVGYLADLSASVPATANAAHYAEAVRAGAMRRAVVRAATLAVYAARDLQRDPAEVAAAVDAALREVADAAAAPTGPVALPDLLQPAWEFVEGIHEGTREPGISTGIPLLDRHINGGLHPGELAVLGAAPSQGKSALAQALSLHIAARSRTVLYATPEMTGLTLALRALAYRSGVDLRRLWGSPRMAADDWPLLSRAVGALSEECRTLWVEDRATTWDAIAAHARRLHARQPLTLLVVDHLHELEWPAGADSEVRALGEIVAGCKRLAKAMGIAVLLLSQLNRTARAEKRAPALHDLRGSGAIEQHADLVLLLHPRVEEGETPPREVSVDVLIGKQRNGPVGALRLLHDRTTGRFRDQREGTVP